MLRRFTSTDGTILVAVKFDSLGEELLQRACELASTGHFSVKAMHVVEPLSAGAWAGAGSDIIQAIDLVNSEHIELMERKLSDWVNKLRPGCSIVSKVLVGVAAQMVAAEALVSGAVCVITGAASRSHRFIPRGLSTALSLMANAPVPVLVLTAEAQLKLKSEPFRILLADDLRDQSTNAVTAGLEFSCLIPRSHVQHLHINGLTEDALGRAVETAQSMAHTAAPLSGTIEKIFQSLVDDLRRQLEQRAAALRARSSQAGIEYEAVVRSGSVLEELDHGIQSFAPHLVVFGRHQTFHHKPFTVGQVPFSSILSQRVPVMVVPSRDQ